MNEDNTTTTNGTAPEAVRWELNYTRLDTYNGEPIMERTSRKGNRLVCTIYGGSERQHYSVDEARKYIDEQIQATHNRARGKFLCATIKELCAEFSTSTVVRAIEVVTDLPDEQLFTSHDGKKYSIDRSTFYNLENPNAVLDLRAESGGFLSGMNFDDAFDIARIEFFKSPSRRSKRTSAEVEFILDELDENWDHSCEQEADDIGNRRYYWHGDKGRFMENFRSNPCSGIDYLETDFNSEFPELEEEPVEEPVVTETTAVAEVKSTPAETAPAKTAKPSDKDLIREAFVRAGKPIPAVYA